MWRKVSTRVVFSVWTRMADAVSGSSKKTPAVKNLANHKPTSSDSGQKWAEKKKIPSPPHRSHKANPKNDHSRSHMPSRLPPRAKSTNSQPSKAQTRTLKTNVTRLHDARSHDTEKVLSDRLKNVKIRGGTPTGQRSTYRGYTSGNGCGTLSDVVTMIREKQAKNIVVMCGAGISTDSGIPDFRSPGTGLYDNLKQYRIPYPEAIFDTDYFQGNPKPFLTLAKELYPIGKYRPNYVHYFLRMLHEKGLLLRIYTQNIDGLERLAGIPAQKLVEAHGSFYTSSCVRCKEPYKPETIRKIIYSDKIPRCNKNRCLGLIKPDIVFFGEDMPRRFYYYLKDMPQADLLVVMGTSLEVDPFAGIVDSVRLHAPRVLFNRNVVGPFKKKRRRNDVVAQGELTSIVKKFVESLGWTEELQTIYREAEAKASEQQVDVFAASGSEELKVEGIIAHPSSQPTAGGSKSQNTTVNNSTTNSRRSMHTSSARPDLISIKNLVTLATPPPVKTSSSKPAQTTNIKSLLPNLVGKTPPSFHSQSEMYRTGKETGTTLNRALLLNYSSSESDESDDSTSSDDDDD